MFVKLLVISVFLCCNFCFAEAPAGDCKKNIQGLIAPAAPVIQSHSAKYYDWLPRHLRNSRFVIFSLKQSETMRRWLYKSLLRSGKSKDLDFEPDNLYIALRVILTPVGFHSIRPTSDVIFFEDLLTSLVEYLRFRNQFSVSEMDSSVSQERAQVLGLSIERFFRAFTQSCLENKLFDKTPEDENRLIHGLTLPDGSVVVNNKASSNPGILIVPVQITPDAAFNPDKPLARPFVVEGDDLSFSGLVAVLKLEFLVHRLNMSARTLAEFELLDDDLAHEWTPRLLKLVRKRISELTEAKSDTDMTTAADGRTIDEILEAYYSQDINDEELAAHLKSVHNGALMKSLRSLAYRHLIFKILSELQLISELSVTVMPSPVPSQGARLSDFRDLVIFRRLIVERVEPLIFRIGTGSEFLRVLGAEMPVESRELFVAAQRRFAEIRQMPFL